ncbi:hypothetical protein [uncultured Ruminobacter sp.]|uniref:hypothetical protein n=1 Tax=uncultured Ruminobacter sp. TaxID=538947 RepID=UPI0025DF8C07|nr:hypothetical protein [uncultured Ruminobacter sp.]
MTEHHHCSDCNDGTHGSYKPNRKIEFLKARLAMIVDSRLYKNVPLKGILELASLINPTSLMLFSTDSDFIADFSSKASELEEMVTLYAPKNEDMNTFIPVCSPKAAKIPKNVEFAKDRDVLASYENEDLLKNLCDIQVENKLSLIPLPLTDMLILKSITTVQPYDLPLARLYLKQYTEAKEALTEADRNLLRDIKEQGLPTLDDSYSEQVYRFLKVERKLFTQYAH